MKITGTRFQERSLRAAAALAARPVLAPKQQQPPSGMFPNFIVPSVQARWLGAGVAWYTPQRVEYIFRQALSGDLQSQWEMFDLMECTWPELSKNENQLKDAVVQMLDKNSSGQPRFFICPFKVGDEPPSEEAQRRAALVEESLYSMRPRPDCDENGLDDLVRDIMDARFKGISVQEVDYEPRELSSGSAICPRATRWVHPSWYGYPFGPGNEKLWLKLGGVKYDNQFQWSPAGEPLPGAPDIAGHLPMGGDLPPIQSPQNFFSASDFTEFPANKFIITVMKNKSGHPLGSAMLHILAWYWAAMNFTLEWFLAFAQIFGQPFRWATYDPNLSDQDQAKLQAMLAGMGAMGYAMFPAGTDMQFKEASGRAADNPQKAIIDIANTACRLLILRQTLSSDTGAGGSGSRALGEVHERVEDDVKIACGKSACRSLQQLVRSICLLNFGNDQLCPTVEVHIPDKDESVNVSQVLSNLHNSDMEPTDEAIESISDNIGFPLQRRAAPVQPPPDQFIPGEKAVTARAMAEAKSPIDAIVGTHSPKLAAAFRGARAPILALLQASTSEEDFRAKVTTLYSDWNRQRVNSVVEEALQLAAAKGGGKQ